MSRRSEAKLSTSEKDEAKSQAGARKFKSSLSGIRSSYKMRENIEDKEKLSLLKKVSDQLQDCNTRRVELNVLLKDAYDKINDLEKRNEQQKKESETLLQVCNEHTESVTRQAKDRIDKYIMEHEEKLLANEERLLINEEKLRIETKANRNLQAENNELAIQIAALREQVVPKAAFDKEIENCKNYVAKAEKYRDELKAEIARLSASATARTPFSFPTTSLTSSTSSQRGRPSFGPSIGPIKRSSTESGLGSGSTSIARPEFPGSRKRSRALQGSGSSQRSGEEKLERK